jgi:NADPH-dependent glutamate synthase beta subunit-like oxidoreductase/NAD(P)H-flavin reductase
MKTSLQLAFDLSFDDLYQSAGLKRVDDAFLRFLAQRDAALRTRLQDVRRDRSDLNAKDCSTLLIEVAEHLEAFVASLFKIESETAALRARHSELDPVFKVRRLFIQRKAVNTLKADGAAAFDGAALEADLVKLMGEPLTDLSFAQHVMRWQDDETAHEHALSIALRYAAWAVHTEAGARRHHSSVLFVVPKKLDFSHLVPVETTEQRGITVHKMSHLRHRDGFKLTDRGTDLAGAMAEAHYCIWCHEQGRDSCSHGLREKTTTEGVTPPFKKTVFGVPLAGCPLEERISEFQKLKTEGVSIGALAMIALDNPMVAATGHRICNDCMKSCIYQKQEPVDIPQAETRTLKDVLELPWGFEIYSLLTRWNPLNLERPIPRPPSGRRVLIAGMGPAGFTLAHHLMNEGHAVVGIDGLKIEPLPPALCGVDQFGTASAFEPVRDIATLYESLDDRVMAGFGGVAEYGITVRWDKNFLKLIRLLLERRREFHLFGGIRFGGTLSTEDAFELGFDHVALCVGAGRPTILELPNGLARGVRTASDFLMALQLTGAAKADSIANMQLRLPVVVIGGGLTAIDTATESLAYYPLQVEKFLSRYEALCSDSGEQAVRAKFSAEEASIADEFLAHGRALRAEITLARGEQRAPRIAQLLQSWGGATIAYRKRLIDAPSYTLNHEEVEKALEEGIWFAEEVTPTAVQVDQFGHARALTVTRDGKSADLPARSILVAAGTQPNTVLAREQGERYELDGRFFQACDLDGRPVSPERSAKPSAVQVLLSKRTDGRFVSFFGDLHPSFAGNVVKAMGSAKRGYPVVNAVLRASQPAALEADKLFFARLSDGLRARVHEVIRLTPNIVEIVVKAPYAAQKFQPGQFYRLQNFETRARKVNGTRLAMEGLALTGAWVDRERGLVSTIVLEMGGSSDLCAELEPGEPVILMGPTGTPTEIPGDETVLLAGGGLGNAVLFSIGAALRAHGSKVLYFAGYKQNIDRYKVAEIEAAADVVVWCCDQAPGFKPTRPQDRSFVGNIVQAMLAYAENRLGDALIPMSAVDRIIAIGSDRMMAAVGAARHGVLMPHLKPHHFAIASINSPMQCMMKEICAQCLQPQRDPLSGVTRYVFSCFNQDQPLDQVDFPGLAQRLAQNSVQEKITAQWVGRCLQSVRRETERVA